MEQDNKNIIWIDFNTNTEKCMASIRDALQKKPELVYVKMCPTWFPNRMMDLPKSFVKFVMQNPKVKIVWDDTFSLNDQEEHCKRKISVITPFYNSQKYIDNYFNKLSKQTFFNQIEVICIDDCSIDDTFSKLVEYSNKYDNIVLLRNDTNMGAGHSRNLGLDIASGEYISFLDSDDWYYAQDSLEKFYLDAVEHNAALCGSAITNILTNGQQKTFFTKENDIQFNNQFVKFDDFQNIYYFTRYLYKRSFLNEHNLRFRNFKRFQDPYFLYEVMVIAKEFFAVPYSTYCYTTNDHWNTLNEKQHYDRIVAISKLMELLPEKHYKIKKFLLLSLVSLFKWDKKLMNMVLSHRDLFLVYYGVFFNDQIRQIAEELPNDMMKLYETIREKLKSHTKVTIIIPVYNGEKYIDRCLKSIFEQTYPNIEIICVDDCSTDNSYKMLNDLSRTHKNLRVFKTPMNSGCCSNPRNIGLSHATGSYVQFVDIDDLLMNENVIGTLVDSCQKNNLDCLRFTFKVLNECETQQLANNMTRYYTLKGNKDSYVGRVMPGVELYFRLKFNNSYQESSALGMFNIEMMRQNGITFIENIIHEDVLFTPMILSNSKRCMQLDKQMYIRSVHGNSIITTTNNNKKRHSFNVILDYIDSDSMQRNVVIDYLCKTIKGVLKNLK